MCFPSPGDSNGIFLTELIRIRQCHRSCPVTGPYLWRRMSKMCFVPLPLYPFPNLSYTSHTHWQNSLCLVKRHFINVLSCELKKKKDEMEAKPPSNKLYQSPPSHKDEKVICVGWRSLWRKKVHFLVPYGSAHIYYNAYAFTGILKTWPYKTWPWALVKFFPFLYS